MSVRGGIGGLGDWGTEGLALLRSLTTDSPEERLPFGELQGNACGVGVALPLAVLHQRN